jgi:primosomal protein N' (replication factor Y) (superfamily II helicase)
MRIAHVALDLPLFCQFDYLAGEADANDVGARVRVPFGRGERVGVLISVDAQSEFSVDQLKPLTAVYRDLPPLPADFLRLAGFAAAYYQAPIGEVLLQALPAGLKRPEPPQRRARKEKKAAPAGSVNQPQLTSAQAAAVAAVAASEGFAPFLLYGVTGSGKTEVYLRLIEKALADDGQALLLVPEINLTPQLEAHVRRRFPSTEIAVLHSELAEAARERNWRAAFTGNARIVLGTRLAVFTPLPALRLILIDEEHDASYKQQDGMRYSARDLAIFRARDRQVPIVLGSATPSLESWANAANGRFCRLDLPERANEHATLPPVKLIDTRRQALQEGLSPHLLSAIETRLQRGEQSLVFLNRRGYAPVLACAACGWTSNCRRCAAHLVVHLADRRLRCHHCGFETQLPRACPCCGNQDIQPFGRGTQKLEAWLGERFPQARILRVDRDSVRSRKQWEALLAHIQSGDLQQRADILVGTQMLAKGHDFPDLTLVGVVGADAALFAADLRAPERLFSQLMQVAGRAGRAERPGEVLVQTQYPDHPLYDALVRHDFAGWAQSLLDERRAAGFPPFTFQAMLRAEAPNMADALAFLGQALQMPAVGEFTKVTIYDPVPMRLARLANLERAQLLVESVSRRQLQAFLPRWREGLEGIKAPSRLRWHLEVDPAEY